MLGCWLGGIGPRGRRVDGRKAPRLSTPESCFQGSEPPRLKTPCCAPRCRKSWKNVGVQNVPVCWKETRFRLLGGLGNLRQERLIESPRREPVVEPIERGASSLERGRSPLSVQSTVGLSVPAGLLWAVRERKWPCFKVPSWGVNVKPVRHFSC